MTSWYRMAAVTAIVAVVSALCAWACSPRQVAGAADFGTAVAGAVDVPAVQEDAVAAYLRSVTERLDRIERERVAAGADGAATMSWDEWLYALLGTGVLGTAASIAGSAYLDRRVDRRRSGSRQQQLEPLADLLEHLAKQIEHVEPEQEREQSRKLVRATRERIRRTT